MRLIGNLCCYDETSKGNLHRCLDNLKQFCDTIIVWDDGSTDNSVEVASHYTPHVILGEKNDQMNELAHKQAMLEKSLALGATHIFWLDCDEVLDRNGTLGGLKALCQEWPDGVDAFGFPEVNLWRGDTWARTDTLFAKARFVRLWKVVPGIRFDVKSGVHLRLYPSTIHRVQEAPFKVLHYGFHDYLRMTEKIGAHLFTREEFQKCAETNWILDERECSCYRVPWEWYPPGCEPVGECPEPLPRKIEELVPTQELWGKETLIDPINLAGWQQRHSLGYHGSYEEIHRRNFEVYREESRGPGLKGLFPSLDPKGKSVCDIGAGGGWFALECLRDGARHVTCLETDPGLIEMGKKSFHDLGVPEEQYEFLPVQGNELWGLLSQVDLIYCLAVFQHIPFQLARTWFRWIAAHLNRGGEAEAHLQFHRRNGKTTFLNSEQDVSIEMLEQDLGNAGLEIQDCRLAEGEGILPVWYMYRVGRGEHSSA